MLSIFLKEANSFFSSLIGYIVIGVFLVIMGLVMFVFPDTSLLNYNYATLDQLFEIAPIIFVFLMNFISSIIMLIFVTPFILMFIISLFLFISP